MKKILENLYQHKTLSQIEAKNILIDISNGKYNSFQVVSFLTVFNMRNINLGELKGFREALVELCIPINLSQFHAMDVCGTGGDGKNTFNISTLVSFILAGAGIPIAKHGNYGVSSISGSSNVLEYLGVHFTNDEKILQNQIKDIGICFLHAPLFHPALKELANIRKNLGIKTFFNMLGPLVNPSQPNKQMVGVFNLELARKYQYLFQEDTKMKNYSILFGLDGFDEISLTDSCKILNEVSEKIIEPDYFGFNKISLPEIHGGNSVKEAAEIFLNLIQGKGNEAQNQVVLANAIIGIQTYDRKISLDEATEQAKESLFGLKALEKFNQLKSYK